MIIFLQDTYENQVFYIYYWKTIFAVLRKSLHLSQVLDTFRIPHKIMVLKNDLLQEEEKCHFDSQINYIFSRTANTYV